MRGSLAGLTGPDERDAHPCSQTPEAQPAAPHGSPSNAIGAQRPPTQAERYGQRRVASQASPSATMVGPAHTPCAQSAPSTHATSPAHA